MNALREALLRGRRRPRTSGTGSPTHYRGDGYEFVELREYAAGDDVRRIDWAATARTGTLQTRVVLEDVALTLAAILDTSDSMRVGRTRSLASAAQEAIDRWFAAALREDRCMRVYSDEVLPLPLRSDTSFELTRALHAAASIVPRGAALLVVSDFWELPLQDDAIDAIGRRFDCTALIARDPWYDDLPLTGFVCVADAQSGTTARLFVGERERCRYREAVREREKRLVERFTAANWRTGIFDAQEEGGVALLHAFGIR